MSDTHDYIVTIVGEVEQLMDNAKAAVLQILGDTVIDEKYYHGTGRHSSIQFAYYLARISDARAEIVKRWSKNAVKEHGGISVDVARPVNERLNPFSLRSLNKS